MNTASKLKLINVNLQKEIKQRKQMGCSQCEKAVLLATIEKVEVGHLDQLLNKA